MYLKNIICIGRIDLNKRSKERKIILMTIEECLVSILKKTMLISEKKTMYKGIISNENLENLNEWKKQKNLVDDKTLQLILEKEKMSEEEFAYSISPIEIEDNYKSPEWLGVLREIFEKFKIEEIHNLKKIDVSIILLPFITFVAEGISDFDWKESQINLSQQAVQDILTNYMMQTFSFYEKCIVIELNKYKQCNDFRSEDKTVQFEEFLKERFATKEDYYDFYERYAVSSRLAATRTIYFLDNMKVFFQNLIDSASEISEKFKIQVGEIQKLELAVGDSHERGKEVILVNFTYSKVVYKPKNLDICESFYDFIELFNENFDGLKLKAPKGVYGKEFAFIEFVEHNSCLEEKGIERFYERFGYILALGYFLAITDLHLENIIADGEYPVIIDGETMMQNSIKYYTEENVFTRFCDKYVVETILTTALLPNTAKIDNTLEVSALSGDEQISQKKYLTAVNVGTSDFHFEELEYLMSGAGNIPLLNGEKVDYKKYCNYIINGFLKVMDYFKNNKMYLIQDEKSLLAVFKNKKIRFLAKSTQKYGDMFSYLNHPECCSEMIIRERILQNIWAYPHKNKDIIKSEYKDMLLNDIPIFYSNTTSLNLYDSYGNIFPKYFSETGYHKVEQRIIDFDEEQLRIQTDLLCLHLGLYHEHKRTEFARRNYTFSCEKINSLAEAERIGEKLILLADEDPFDNIAWKNINIGENNANFGLTGIDLYDGISGIALFFLELYKITEKQKYYRIYHKCMKNCEKDFDYSVDEYNAYSSKFSVLWPIMVEIEGKGESKYEKLIHKAVELLEGKNKKDIINSKKFAIDWISGISGLLVLMLELKSNIKCLTDKEVNILTKFTKELQEIILEQLDSGFGGVGQAHGYSGVMLALARSCKDMKRDSRGEIEKVIISCLKKEMEMYELEKSESRDKWCHGLSGMIQSRLEIEGIISSYQVKLEVVELTKKLIECQKDMYFGDTLCHGNAGTLYIIKQLIESNTDYTEELQIILNKMLAQMCGNSLYQGYQLSGTQCVNNSGLFMGYAGVGFALLKITNNVVNNVFTFSL